MRKQQETVKLSANLSSPGTGTLLKNDSFCRGPSGTTLRLERRFDCRLKSYDVLLHSPDIYTVIKSNRRREKKNLYSLAVEIKGMLVPNDTVMDMDIQCLSFSVLFVKGCELVLSCPWRSSSDLKESENLSSFYSILYFIFRIIYWFVSVNTGHFRR